MKEFKNDNKILLIIKKIFLICIKFTTVCLLFLVLFYFNDKYNIIEKPILNKALTYVDNILFNGNKKEQDSDSKKSSINNKNIENFNDRKLKKAQQYKVLQNIKKALVLPDSIKRINFDDVRWVKNKENNKWNIYLNDDIEKTSGIICIIDKYNKAINSFESATYGFDELGDMITGWGIDSNGNYYYFDEADDAYGTMCTGWKEIDNKYYYFLQNGMMLYDTITPDGYYVNETGEYYENHSIDKTYKLYDSQHEIMEDELKQKQQLIKSNLDDSDVNNAFEISNDYVDSIKKLRKNMIGSNGSLFLLKNNKFYSLMNFILSNKGKELNVGYHNGTDDPFVNIYTIYQYSKKTDDYQNYLTYQSIGDIKPINLLSTDKIIGYNTNTIHLTPAKFIGKTIKNLYNSLDVAYYLIISQEATVRIDFPYITDFAMVDSLGGEVSTIDSQESSRFFRKYKQPDFSNLIADEMYTLSWFENSTDYKEYKVIADSYMYGVEWLPKKGVDYTTAYKYHLNGKLNKEGYCTFDLSEISKGLYYLYTGCFILIN